MARTGKGVGPGIRSAQSPGADTVEEFSPIDRTLGTQWAWLTSHGTVPVGKQPKVGNCLEENKQSKSVSVCQVLAIHVEKQLSSSQPTL